MLAIEAVQKRMTKSISARNCSTEQPEMENSFQFFPLIGVALPSTKNAHVFIINKIEINFGKF